MNIDMQAPGSASVHGALNGSPRNPPHMPIKTIQELQPSLYTPVDIIIR